jgi:hypothetical protein
MFVWFQPIASEKRQTVAAAKPAASLNCAADFQSASISPAVFDALMRDQFLPLCSAGRACTSPVPVMSVFEAGACQYSLLPRFCNRKRPRQNCQSLVRHSVSHEDSLVRWYKRFSGQTPEHPDTERALVSE